MAAKLLRKENADLVDPAAPAVPLLHIYKQFSTILCTENQHVGKNGLDTVISSRLII